MKTYILLFTLILAAACSSNDGVFYDESPRLDFEVTSQPVVFNDKDYIGNITEKVSDVQISLMGKKLDEARTFCLKSVKMTEDKFQGDIQPEDFYTMPINSFNVKATFKVKRPVVFDKTYKAYLFFDFENRVHQFLSGRVEKDRYRVDITFHIKPATWQDEWSGEYSNGKYCFMMKHFAKTLDEVEKTAENKIAIRNAYATYRQNNPPVMDDNIPAEEIVFP